MGTFCFEIVNFIAKAKADEAAAAQRQVELQAAKKELEAALEEVKVSWHNN